MQVIAWDHAFCKFRDLPTSLKALVGPLADWLQANPSRPTVQTWSEHRNWLALRWTIPAWWVTCRRCQALVHL